ncbi:MAG: SDR family NAD(P)-dependent oxidoreductase [Clostridiales bacterium]|nr:SDR family NAD(P)-dependent oxidoreductase [Clostridiales bacterium]
MSKKNIVIITGASSGIGQEFAMQLDGILHKTDELWLIARRKNRLMELARLLDIPTKIIAMDMADKNDMRVFKKILEIEDVTIRMLINSAGFGIMGAFAEMDIDEQLAMLDVNCKALTEMTYYCIPYMQRNSRIIQIASSAGFLPQKNFAIYAASKSYVLSFSRALREELKPRKIWVTAVCPGPVETEFFDKAERTGSTLAIKKYTMVSVQKVVKEALLDSRDKKAVSVCSFSIKSFRILAKMMPHSWLLGISNLLK